MPFRILLYQSHDDLCFEIAAWIVAAMVSSGRPLGWHKAGCKCYTRLHDAGIKNNYHVYLHIEAYTLYAHSSRDQYLLCTICEEDENEREEITIAE